MTSASRPEVPRQALRLLPFFLMVLVGLSVWRLSSSTEPQQKQPHAFTGKTMGTTFTVKVVDRLAHKRVAQVDEAIKRALSLVDEAMSTYRPNSELSRFNSHAVVDAPFSISPSMRRVVQVALDVGKRSDGALDITVGPVVDAWGFGSQHIDSPPSPEKLSQLLPLVGLDKIDLLEAGFVKHVAGVRCDLSAIAKGFAVDEVARALDALDIKNYLVEVGGELRAKGHRADGSAFRVGIEKPLDNDRAVEQVIALANMAMATSGDYRNFFDDHGTRRSHFIDPRTAAPVTHNLASVTVLHEEAAWADAWATALSVLGPTRAPKVAEREHLAALFLVRESTDGFRTIETSAFSKLRRASHL